MSELQACHAQLPNNKITAGVRDEIHELMAGMTATRDEFQDVIQNPSKAHKIKVMSEAAGSAMRGGSKLMSAAKSLANI